MSVASHNTPHPPPFLGHISAGRLTGHISVGRLTGHISVGHLTGHSARPHLKNYSFLRNVFSVRSCTVTLGSCAGHISVGHLTGREKLSALTRHKKRILCKNTSYFCPRLRATKSVLLCNFSLLVFPLSLRSTAHLFFTHD